MNSPQNNRQKFNHYQPPDRAATEFLKKMRNDFSTLQTSPIHKLNYPRQHGGIMIPKGRRLMANDQPVDPKIF
jgi:hypothetical protein|tara:strand:- start:237 stop:455 length:219 start_codon:yes stop_codon:yes gene_type:complete